MLFPGRRVLLFFVLVVAWIVASFWLFIFPRQDSPSRADAVVVLSGAKNARLERALELMRRRVAPVLVISDATEPGSPRARALCRRGSTRFRVVCFRPDPYSTRGEAQALARLARRRGWGSVVVVTSKYHLTRARMLFRRCVDGDVEGVGARFPLRRVLDYVFAEWGKLAYALTLERGC